MLALVLVLAVQTPASVQQAAQSITASDIRRRVGIIADDSMRGRDTPSPELDEVAQYLAREYRRLGLKPAGERGTFVQRYALDRVQIMTDSSVAFVHGAAGDATLSYGKDFAFADNAFGGGDYAGDAVLLRGPLRGPIGVDTAALAGKMLVVVARGRGLDRVIAWKPAGVFVVSDAPDSVWSLLVSRTGAPDVRDPTSPAGTPIFMLVRKASLQGVVARAGADLSAAPGNSLTATPLPGVQLHVHARVKTLEKRSAPNVVAILEGSDPTLKSEYVVFSAHMDHVGVAGPRGSGGCRAQGADSICNGADDDGSGTVTVVELAEAFARVSPKPRRSILFLNVSGEEKGLWGSAYFADHPTVPMSNVVANLNIDMVGRNWRDTIVAIGKEH